MKIYEELLPTVDYVVCYASVLAGDLLMQLAGLVNNRKADKVGVVVGTYTKEMWEFVLKHLEGFDEVKIVGIIDDPDDGVNEFCPGWGYPALNSSHSHAKVHLEKVGYKGEVFKLEKFGNAYGSRFGPLKLKDSEVQKGEHIAVHTFTSHRWKNCDDVISRAKFRAPTVRVGYNSEPAVRQGTYEDKALATINSKGACCVLSSFNCLATLFYKDLITVSFTQDCRWVKEYNPNAHTLLCPSLPQLQEKINELGW